MKSETLLLLILGAAALLGSGHAAGLRDGAPPQSTRKDAAKTQPSNTRGAELFETHCGRCHKPPDDLSPRVAPAIVAHMRTRAMLSREDEQEILKFLAP